MMFYRQICVSKVENQKVPNIGGHFDKFTNFEGVEKSEKHASMRIFRENQDF